VSRTGARQKPAKVPQIRAKRRLRIKPGFYRKCNEHVTKSQSSGDSLRQRPWYLRSCKSDQAVVAPEGGAHRLIQSIDSQSGAASGRTRPQEKLSGRACFSLAHTARRPPAYEARCRRKFVDPRVPDRPRFQFQTPTALRKPSMLAFLTISPTAAWSRRGASGCSRSAIA
jgi:hypothetical protein